MRGYHGNGSTTAISGLVISSSPICSSRPSPPASAAITTPPALPRAGRIRTAHHLPQLLGLRRASAAQRQLRQQTGLLRRVPLPAVAGQRQLQPQQLPVHPEVQRVLPHHNSVSSAALRPVFLPQQFRGLWWRRSDAPAAGDLGIASSEGSFTLQAFLSGMAAEDCLRVELPPEFGQGAVSGLLDRLLPADADAQREIAGHFDLRPTPTCPTSTPYFWP